MQNKNKIMCVVQSAWSTRFKSEEKPTSFENL